MLNQPSIPEVLGWETSGFDKYRIKQKKKHCKKHFFTFLNRRFLKPKVKVTAVIEELYWQLETLQLLFQESFPGIVGDVALKKFFNNRSTKDQRHGKKTNL